MTCLDKCFNALMITIILGVEDFDRAEKGSEGFIPILARSWCH